VSIAEGDSRVAALLAGHSYTVSAVLPWARINTDFLIGADITFSWEDPTTIETDWPMIAYDDYETQNPPYSESTTHFTASGTKSIDVLVDLTRGLVVSIEPGVEAEISGGEPLMAFSVQRRATRVRGQRDFYGGLQPLSTEEVTAGPRPPANRMRRLCFGGDCFWNYDFTPTARYHGVRSDRVDWPIDLIFENASLSAVREGLEGMGHAHTGGTMWALLDDGAGKFWDPDNGKKSTSCPAFFTRAARHFRVYAQEDPGYMVNSIWGRYVLGTSHYDRNECITPFGWGRWSGHSEDLERWLADRIENDALWEVFRESVNLYNAESGDRGRHRKLNSGYATRVVIPQTP
jgi:hypothetical protein